MLSRTLTILSSNSPASIHRTIFGQAYTLQLFLERGSATIEKLQSIYCNCTIYFAWTSRFSSSVCSRRPSACCPDLLTPKVALLTHWHIDLTTLRCSSTCCPDLLKPKRSRTFEQISKNDKSILRLLKMNGPIDHLASLSSSETFKLNRLAISRKTTADLIAALVPREN